MNLVRTTCTALLALTSLAVTSLASTARADHQGFSINNSLGSGDVQASYFAEAGLTSCNATNLAGASTLVPVPGCTLPAPFCPRVPQDPLCMVDATEEYASVDAQGGGGVTLFGDQRSLWVALSATTADGASSMNITVVGFGLTLLDQGFSTVPIGYGISYGAEKDFSVAGVSVKVDGEANAWIGATLGGGAITDGFEVTATPTITVGVDASARAGVSCASAGIDGSVDVLDLTVPSSFSLAYSGGTLTFGVDSSFDYSALSGSLDVSACLCGECASDTIASYGGFNGSYSIYNASGSLSL